MSPTEPRVGAIFWNPAVIGLIPNTEFETNLALIGGGFSYKKSGIDPNTGVPYKRSTAALFAPIPYLAISSDLGTRRFRFAYSTYFPTGMMADFEDDSAQRYDILAGTFIPWNHQFTVAYQLLPELTLAASGIFSLAFFETELDVDLASALSQIMQLEGLPSENPALSSRATIPLNTDYQIGFAVGALYKPTRRFSAGLSFTSPLRFKFRQDLKLESPRLVTALGAGPTALGLTSEMTAKASIRHAIPGILQLGASYIKTRYWRGSYFARYIFTSLEDLLHLKVESSNIGVLKDLEVDPVERRDSMVFGTVQTFRISQEWNLGGHFSYYLNSVDDQNLSTTRLDLDTILLGVFARYRLGEHFYLGGEYSHNFMIDRRVNNSIKASSSPYVSPVVNNGHYQATADRVALTVTYGF